MDWGYQKVAQITYAAIQFTVDEISLGLCQVLIETTVGADVDAFTSDVENLSRRIRSIEQVSWDIPDWKRIGESGEDQRTPNLSSLLQEVLDEPEWNSGGSMVFLFSGTGRRTAESWDGKASSAPLLWVEYSVDEVLKEPFIAYNDLSWDSGQLTMNITRYTTDEGTGIPPDGSEGSLVDYESGDVLPVQLRVDGGRWNGPIHAAVGSSVLPQTGRL